MKHTILFTAIASILTINAFADTKTITTQDYVDAADTLKQDKISASGTDASGFTRPVSVITDTDIDGVVAKRFIIEGSDNGGGDGFLSENDLIGDLLANNQLSTELQQTDIADLNADDIKKSIVPVGVLEEAFSTIQRHLNLKQPKKNCVQYIDGAAQTSENCLLWNLPD